MNTSKAQASKSAAKAYLLAEGGDSIHIDSFLDALTWDDSDYEYDYDFYTEYCEFAALMGA